ncbi:hypothetical protein Ga0466249_004312 [Sporomusaceae bacterium BoRhaA]|uniref:hypothetical protein n=1 Tax=Pelorhabdus rhamnosifermentans TaxID=2772457 RepID=UPI001C06212C|nr:hypothetical protein [Pelorhabdus rhamnosifermentans]MBU2703176.1 hypothetical protein [Pelorhabdus rhamnosifermentans]
MPDNPACAARKKMVARKKEGQQRRRNSWEKIVKIRTENCITIDNVINKPIDKIKSSWDSELIYFTANNISACKRKEEKENEQVNTKPSIVDINLFNGKSPLPTKWKYVTQ